LLLLPLLKDPTSLPSKILGSFSSYGVSALKSTNIPSFLPTKIQNEIVPVLPFWVLITLAAYLLGRLGLGVMRFKDCEDAYKELMGHIEKAKKDLDSRKVSWS
jgi:Dolichol-phosphate mannosyltransferase subunit 3 (DPM3)